MKMKDLSIKQNHGQHNLRYKEKDKLRFKFVTLGYKLVKK